MLITFVVDACEWNHWIIVYVQIVIHYHIISDLDPYDVVWVVRLVLEDMGEVMLLVVDLCWDIIQWFSI